MAKLVNKYPPPGTPARIPDAVRKSASKGINKNWRLPRTGAEEALTESDRTERNALETEVQEATPDKPLNANLPPLHGRDTRDARSRIADWILLKATEPGITNIEIAKRMGIQTQTLNTLIYKATKAGWLVFDDPLEQIEHQIIPKTLENLNHFLDAKDKQVTIETAKGTVFPMFKESRGLGEAQVTVLSLKIEQPEPSTEMRVVTGTVVGRPRQIKESNE